MKTRTLILMCTLLPSVCGCRIEPPLHLRQTLDLEVALELDLDVDLIWQVDWETRWTFSWNADVLGELGYEAPASFRMHAYAWGADNQIRSEQVFNFMGTSGSVKAVAGTYDFLFYNNDSETLLFDTSFEGRDVYAYTRTISSGLQYSSPVKSSSQKAADTKAEAEMKSADDPVVLQPDCLFSLYTPEQTVSDNPADYEYIDGRYVIRVGGTMKPANFIWLIQIRLLNNNGRVLGSAGGCALTGLAAGVDLQTGISSTASVSIPTDVRINRSVDPDLMGARLVSFGIPGCNAYDPQSVAAAPTGNHFLVLSIAYSDGGYKNIHVDVTDQVRALPTGGVITLELDVNDFPPEEGHQGGSGGFNPLLNDWTTYEGGHTIIN